MPLNDRITVPRFSTSAALSLLAATGALMTMTFVSPAANAIVRSESGQKCTIVGSNGPDTLRGTRKKDVICGRGGNDRIYGRSGNDIIDGGKGNDRIYGDGGKDRIRGGAGDDTVVGGAGNDTVQGQTGNDTIDGGAGTDVLQGQDGNDQLLGGTGNDTLIGQIGNDTIDGGTGADKLEGGSGNDTLRGASGNDVLRGDGGNDAIDGDEGNDVIYGNDGNDQLTGGAGADRVDGGTGFNLCDVAGPGDSQVKCALDKKLPKIVSLDVTPPTVDVSHRARTISVTIRAVDDTGVAAIEVDNRAFELVSGDARDGIWRVSISVPRFVQPGPRDLWIMIKDRVGRTNDLDAAGAYTVANTVLDKAKPELRSLTLSPKSIDVRSKGAYVTGTVRITDDAAGSSRVLLCPMRAFPNSTPKYLEVQFCGDMELTSGSQTDGIWKGRFWVEKGDPGGVWNASVVVYDAASEHQSSWVGPEAWASLVGSTPFPDTHPIPAGSGSFNVVGSPTDTVDPVLESVTLSPAKIDTSNGAVRVTASVKARDAGGITEVYLDLGGFPDNGAEGEDWKEFIRVIAGRLELVSGTNRNGVWEISFDVPGGTPDGEYPITVSLQDSHNSPKWTALPAWQGYGIEVLTPSLAPNGTGLTVENLY